MEERYQRQIILKGFGTPAQERLKQAKVLVIGAGGLGCPVLQYLTGAGVGTLGIVDDDIVSLYNLHRQILYKMEDIGKSKSLCAKLALNALNPDIIIHSYDTRLTNRNALEIISDYDVVVDGTDNFSSRYIINDACILLNRPFVYGAISQFEGQLAVFNLAGTQEIPVNYRDLFPEPPGEKEVLNCDEIGVLGVLPGIIGSMQANETIKIITGLGKPLANQLFTYQALTCQSYVIQLFRNEETPQPPKTVRQFQNFNYDLFCSPGTAEVPEIDAAQLKNMLDNEEVTILDIRKNGSIRGFEKSRYFHRIPFEKIKNDPVPIKGNEIVVICQAGISSRKAVKNLMSRYGTRKRFYSLRGGLIEWHKYLANPLYYGKKT